ncbi:hypothetical protein DMUE_0566 [Dictyocoela muelleri]|nr:hypothetical protein DMUE_0566 [Dictyocoela muelleri]
MMIRLLNGSVIKANESTVLDIKYSSSDIKDIFYTIENGIIDVTIGSELIKKIQKKDYPIECQIKTTGNRVVSWSRPIKNLKDKHDFKKLIEDFERKGYIEKSRSVWLNPVVLNIKKSGI